jgi:hypothetical protein
MIKQNTLAKDLILSTHTIVFKDVKEILVSTEDEMQRAVYALNNINVK